MPQSIFDGVIYKTCINGNCGNPDNVTEIKYTSTVWDFFWEGNADFQVRLAADPAHGRVANVVKIRAAISWKWFKEATLSARLQEPWANAFGQPGLTLTQAELSITANIEHWTLTITSTAKAAAVLSDALGQKLGIAKGAEVGAKVQFVNFTPIVQVTVSDKNKPGTLNPLAAAGLPATNQILSATNGEIAITPFGGTFNGKTYKPGVWISIDGDSQGGIRHIDAQYDFGAGRFWGSGSAQALSIGTVTVNSANVSFEFGSAKNEISLTGNVSAGSGTATLTQGTVSYKDGRLHVAFNGNASNITIGAVSIVDLGFHVDATFSPATVTSSAHATVAFNATTFGMNDGRLDFQNGSITAFSGTGSIDNLPLGAVTIATAKLGFNVAPGVETWVTFSGSVPISGGPTLGVTKGEVKSNGGVVSVDFKGGAANFDAGPVHVDELSAGVTVPDVTKLSAVTTATAKANIKGASVDVNGTLTLAGGTVTGFAGTGSFGPWTLGAVKVKTVTVTVTVASGATDVGLVGNADVGGGDFQVTGNVTLKDGKPHVHFGTVANGISFGAVSVKTLDFKVDVDLGDAPVVDTSATAKVVVNGATADAGSWSSVTGRSPASPATAR